MSENTNAMNGGNPTPNGGDKTFSQAELDRIISERLSRERSNAATTLAQREQELNHREFMLEAKSTLTDKGLPVDLLEALNTSSPEAFQKSLDIFEEHVKKIVREKNPVPPMAQGVGQVQMIGNGPGIDEMVRDAFGLK